MTPPGSGNPISSASSDGKRSAIPGEEEHVAASAGGNERTILTDGAKPNRHSNSSGTMSPADAAEKCNKDCHELLSQAICDAESLSRSNVCGNTEPLRNVK